MRVTQILRCLHRQSLAIGLVGISQASAAACLLVANNPCSSPFHLSGDSYDSTSTVAAPRCSFQHHFRSFASSAGGAQRKPLPASFVEEVTRAVEGRASVAPSVLLQHGKDEGIHEPVPPDMVRGWPQLSLSL